MKVQLDDVTFEFCTGPQPFACRIDFAAGLPPVARDLTLGIWYRMTEPPTPMENQAELEDALDRVVDWLAE